MSSKTGKMVLTDDLEIHIMELKRVIAEYEKDKDSELLQWMLLKIYHLWGWNYLT